MSQEDQPQEASTDSNHREVEIPKAKGMALALGNSAEVVDGDQ